MYARLASVVAVVTTCLATNTSAQPACQIPAPGDHETHLLWGGETRQIFTWDVAGVPHVLTAEDGGRIRRSTDGGATWAFAETPADISQSLLDVWVADDGVTAYACGRGGKVLKSLDGGATWDHLYPADPIIYDPNGHPATLWRVRFLSENVGLICGLWVFQGTGDAGASWFDIELYTDQTLSEEISLHELEVYCLDFVGTPGDFVAAAGAERKEHDHGDGASAGVPEPYGLVFHTDTSLPESSFGRRWWVTLDDGADTTTPGSMSEPWDIEFEKGTTVQSTAVGYVVGGPGGNSTSRHYRTDDGGATWTFEGNIPVTMYGVAAMPNGHAIQVGYSGNIWSRDTTTGVWQNHPLPASGGVDGLQTLPMTSANGSTELRYVAAGSWGFQRATVDYAQTWVSINPSYQTQDELPWRVNTCYFMPSDPDTGFIVGQRQLIAKTTDGGCTWTAVHAGFPVPQISASNLNDITFADDLWGVAVGDLRANPNQSADLYYTCDGGDTWKPSLIVGSGNHDQFVIQAVSHADNWQYWAVGYEVIDGAPNQPVILYTRTRGAAWFRMSAPALDNLLLNDVEFVSGAEGIILGNKGGAPRAYRADFTGLAVTYTQIALPSVPGHLHQIAMEGADLATADGYTVGDGGAVLQWNGAGFDVVDTTCTYNGASLTLSVNLTSVAMAPNGPEVVIGAQYDSDESHALEEALMLRFDGAAWSCFRALAGYDVSSIDLAADGTGHFVGSVHPQESASFDHGQLADSGVFRYEPN